MHNTQDKASQKQPNMNAPNMINTAIPAPLLQNRSLRNNFFSKSNIQKPQNKSLQTTLATKIKTRTTRFPSSTSGKPKSDN